MPWYPKAIVLVVGLLHAFLLAVPGLRRWAARVDLRWLIGLHLVRYIGFYFLYLYAHDELPYRFAVWGGWGDIVVATLAFVAIFFRKNLLILTAWNLLGLFDILLVAITAARTEMAVPGSMHRLDQFPLILLPTVVVPLVIVTHLGILFRTLGARPRS